MAISGSTVLNAAGGLGLFLLGMGLMSEALRHLAGGRLRQLLLRCTRSPWSGALAGAVSTALLQSSTATTVATVGFVSAGLLSFEASLGIIFGANLGSTGLGWLVALLGIQFDLAGLMLPLLLAGASLRLLGRGRQAQIGQALAGVALLFIGLAAQQQALAGHGLLLDPSRFDAALPSGRLQLLLLGLIITVITHSSGAGVASTLAALAAGAIALPQACALVIGMDVGTTITALIASLGASLNARRTAIAHVSFNLLTAVAAFLLLPAYLAFLPGDGAFALTAFHSGFNLLGVVLVLPLTRPFAALIRQLVPALRGRAVDQLADTPPPDPTTGLVEAGRALVGCGLELLKLLGAGLGQASGLSAGAAGELAGLQADLDRLELYLEQIHLAAAQQPAQEDLLHLLHGLDHLQRLHERCEEEQDRWRMAARSDTLIAQRQQLLAAIAGVLHSLERGEWSDAAATATACARALYGREAPDRREVLAAVASGALDLDSGTDRLEAMRWLRRVSQHLERLCNHLAALSPALFKGLGD